MASTARSLLRSTRCLRQICRPVLSPFSSSFASTSPLSSTCSLPSLGWSGSSSTNSCLSSRHFTASAAAPPSSASDSDEYSIRAFRIHHTHTDGTTLDSVSLGAIKPNEVLVSNRFIGVNFIDNYHRRGLYPLPYPATLGREASGIVEKVGSSVHGIAEGDRVVYYAPGSYADSTIVPAERVVRLPADISLDQGAAFLLQGLTVHYLVHDSYPIKRGDTVLIHAAAGATGILLTQVAKHLGAHVIGTCSSQAKAIKVRGIGADHVVVYNRSAGESSKIGSGWVDEVMKITSGHGVSAVYDSIGAQTFEGSLQCLKPRGTLVLFGQSSGKAPMFDPIRLSKGSYFLTRPVLDHYVSTQKELMDRSEEIWKWYRSGIKPHIHGIYPFEDALNVLNMLENGETSGKLLLKPDN